MTALDTETSAPVVGGSADEGGAVATGSATVPALVIVVRGVPAPQGSKRHVGRGVMIESSKKVKPWRQDVVAAARDAIEKIPARYSRITADGIREPQRGFELPAGWSHGSLEYNDGSVRPMAPTEVVLLPFDGPLAVRMVFTFTRPRSHYRTGRNAHLLKADAPCQPQSAPDLSKLIRSTEDALTTAGAWADDARVVEYDRAAKVYVGEDPEALDTTGARIEIRQVRRG